MLFLYKGHPKHIQEPSSFRPISLLDSAGKLMERLVLNRMTESTDLQLAPNQYGFRRGRNTLEAMEEVLRYAAHAAEGWSKTGTCVSWSPSTSVMHLIRRSGDTSTSQVIEFGLPRYIRDLLRSYLWDRKITIPVNGSTQLKNMTCGIQQGSVLGPIL